MKFSTTFIIFALSSFGFVAAQSPNPTGGELTPRAKSILKDVSAIAGSESDPAGSQAGVDGAELTGEPPAAGTAAASLVNPAQDFVAIATDQKPQQLENGQALGVELLQAGTTPVNPKQLTLRAPYPAKPLSAAPAGWHLAVAENAPRLTRVVELAKGVKVALTVKPHILIPDSNGAEIFAIAEPGYNASLGVQQTTTVGSILGTSIDQLDEGCIQLGSAIDSLQQLLIALPKPESQPAPPATSGKKR